ERLTKQWTAPIYAFFHPIPRIEYVNSRRSHFFLCAAKQCLNRTNGVRRYLDKRDSKSTSNMRTHAKKCWTADVLKAADTAKTAAEIREIQESGALSVQLITSAFKRLGKGKGKVLYSSRQYTNAECRAEVVRWITESVRPFNIVSDRGFLSLMKTGRPMYYIPGPRTVS
ncbi:hypothetical protein BD779DRAFT_1407494, partial [Infundibulicybe gibba]